MSYKTDEHSKKGTKANMAKRRAKKRKLREKRITYYRHLDRMAAGDVSLTSLAKRGTKRGSPVGDFLGLMLGMGKQNIAGEGG